MTNAVNIAQTGTINSSWRNRIINGAMVIDQRNAGASITPASQQYALDRWICGLTQASKYTVQQNAGAVTPPVGFTNYSGITSTSAYSVASGDIFYYEQRIEGFNVADLGFGTANASLITISFWVRSSLTGTFGGALRNVNNTLSYPFNYSIPVANTWTQISIVVAGPTTGTWNTTNSVGLRVTFALGGGSTYSGTAGSWSASEFYTATGAVSVVGTSGATFYITGVQLEKGSTATPFDYRGIGQELSLCQRYYEKSFPLATKPIQNSGAANGALIASGWSTTAFTILASTSFSVTKRAIPSTITTYNPFAVGSGWSRSGSSNFAVGDYATGENSIGLRVNESIVSSGNMSIHWSVEAEL
jgi:hypothetical protein